MPPLRWYSHAWRLVLCLIISAASWSSTWGGQWQEHRAQFWVDLGVGVAALALSFQRRRWPFFVALILAAATAVSAAAIGPAILAAVSFATHRKVGRIVVLGVLLVVAALTYSHTQPISGQGGLRITVSGNAGHPDSQSSHGSSVYLDLLGAVLLTSGVLGWGMYLGSRRELLWTLRDRAESAEAERDLRVANARTTERARIAREMHDVVAHRISQVSMQSGAMAFRDDLDVDQLRAGAQQIQSQANLALAELRGVLGVLRDRESHELLVQPQPTYSDVQTMITDSIQSGMSIEFHDLIGPDADLPETAGRTVFRIVQEGLTNARKHAPGALVRVELSGSREGGIEVLISNGLGFVGTPAAPGSGLGLIGLTERAELQGGRLEGRREGAAFVLRGWIPWAP